MADVNYESYVNKDGITILGRFIPAYVDPLKYDDILKFSNCHNTVVDNCTVLGGREDCIDAVRGSKYTFNNVVLTPHSNGVTIKGSISDVTFKDIRFTKNGSRCDIELGQFDNYWFIGRAPTRRISLDNVRCDHGKVKVTVWNSEVPKVTNSNVKIRKIPFIVWFPYFVVRCIQVRGWKGLWNKVPDKQFIKTP